MAGWESKRHSARHALILALNGPATATKILVDTCILYTPTPHENKFIKIDMHCLNAFQFISIFAGNFQKGTLFIHFVLQTNYSPPLQRKQMKSSLCFQSGSLFFQMEEPQSW